MAIQARLSPASCRQAGRSLPPPAPQASLSLYRENFDSCCPRNRQGFSHREADEKSRLDEAIRRGMGGAGHTDGRASVKAGLMAIWPAIEWELLTMRAAVAKPVSLLVENTAQGVAIECQLAGPMGLRHAETRILAEEPRLATAAVGTSRQGRVVIRHLVEGLIGQFRRLAQRLRETYHPERLRGVGRRRQDQKHPGTIGLLSLRGVPEPVVSDLVKASRQDVLKEAH